MTFPSTEAATAKPRTLRDQPSPISPADTLSRPLSELKTLAESANMSIVNLLPSRVAKGPPSSTFPLLPDGLRSFGVCATVAGAMLLTACASTPEPKIVTREVQVPVAIKCAAPLTSEPQYADTPESLKAAPDIFGKVQLLLAGRAQRQARITELTASISGCVG